MSLGVVGVVILVAIWAVVARLFDQALILPGPIETFTRLVEEISGQAFYRHLGLTAMRALLGFGASLLTGMVWGVAAGLSPTARSILAPAMVLIRSTPLIAVILLAIIWFSPEAAPILVTWLMVMPLVEEVIEQGIRRTETALLEMAKIFRVPAGRVLRDIHLPTLQPYLRASAHSGLGMAYKVTVAAEVLIQPPWGLGGAMQEARFYLDTPRILALTLTVVILSGVTEGVLRLVDRAADRRASSGGESVTRGEVLKAVPGDGAADSAESGAPVIELTNISKAFNERPVLDGITLAAERGRVTVVLGPSGCGKTTLLRIVAGLETPDGGSVLRPSDSPTTMVFQEPRVLEWRSAEENIAFVLPGGKEGEAGRWLDRVGLSAYARAKPPVLSGGMVQRLSLARAFAVPAAAILMDEPFQNLDLRTKLLLCGTTRRLHQERRGATLFVTHDVVEAALVADRIVVLSGQPARVVMSRPINLPEEVRDPRHPRIQSVVGELYEVLLSSSQQ